MAHVYHWKHGWIPLDHTAALSKAKGKHDAAARMLADAHGSEVGIHNRRDVARAITGLPSVPLADRQQAKHHIVEAARLHNSTDLLPPGLQPHTPRLSVRASSYRGQEGHIVGGTDMEGRKVQVFVPGPRSNAEHVAARVRSGQEPFSHSPPKSSAVEYRVGHVPTSVTAHINGERVGELAWHPEHKHVTWVTVYDEQHRRKGIATGMLRHAQSIDPAVHHQTDPSGLTKAGAAFARKAR